MTEVMDMDAYQMMLGSPEESPELVRRVVMAALEKLGNASSGPQGDDVVCQGDQFILPEAYVDDLDGAIAYLKQVRKQRNVEHTFTRAFKYRWNDVAHAFYAAMRKTFSSTGLGVDMIVEVFGIPKTIKPGFITIEVGYGKTLQIPQHKIAFPPLSAEFVLGRDYNEEVGWHGTITANAPKGNAAKIEGFFEVVENELQKHSIYKGHAITAAETPGFLDPKAVDPSRVFYAPETLAELQAHLWGPIEFADELQAVGVPFKQSILLTGDYGNGKSLAASITARKCVENKVTFIQVRPGDDLVNALQLAQLYSPALVFMEDADAVAEAGEPEQASILLDAFDGIGAKGKQVKVVMTTNHPDEIQQGMMRPGRTDVIVHIGTMDAGTCRRLIETLTSELTLIGVDWDAVTDAFGGYSSAFIVEGVHRAMRNAVISSGGKPEFLSTEHFVTAAASLQDQRERMERATAIAKLPNLDAAVRNFIQESMDGTGVFYAGRNDQASYRLHKPE